MILIWKDFLLKKEITKMELVQRYNYGSKPLLLTYRKSLEENCNQIYKEPIINSMYFLSTAYPQIILGSLNNQVR